MSDENCVEDLDSKVKQLTGNLDRLENEYRVQEKDRTVIYRGTIYNLRFDGSEVRGKARLSRFDRKTEDRYKIVSLVPPKIKKVPVEIETKVWSFKDEGRFVEDGEPEWGVYRVLLVINAKRGGIRIEDKLLDLVFSPIVSQLMVWYQVAEATYEGRTYRKTK